MIRKNLDQHRGPTQTRLGDVLAQSGLSGVALVSTGELMWQSGDIDAPYVIYSLTKPVICAALLLLVASETIDIDAELADDRFGRATMRQLMSHTAGVRDYGGLAEYHQAVRRAPSEPWSDEEFLRRAVGAGAGSGSGTGPGLGWAYSNTGYLLLRQVLDRHGGLASFLPGLGFSTATVAEQLTDLARAVPARSSLIGTELLPVAGRYHPGWVGHRTLVTTARELHQFWSRLPTELKDPANLVPVDVDTGGLFARPSYGLGVMADPGSSVGLVVGHGGGGPGYSAAVFTAPGHEAIAIVLEPREDFPAQQLAMDLLQTAVQDTGSRNGVDGHGS